MSDIASAGKPPQSIEQLQARYEAMLRKKQQADKEFSAAEALLNSHKDQARNAYGTDDIEKLKSMLSEWTTENEKLRREYEASLNQIESRLSAIQFGSEVAE